MKKNMLILSTILVFIDQIVKNLIMRNITIYDGINIIPNFFSITYVKNTGAAFGVLSGNRWLLVAVGVITLLIIIKFILLDKNVTKYDSISYSLLVSGTIGNLIDRIFYGSVVDYLSFNLFGYNAPVFNFADMCIVFGAFMILYVMVIKGESYEINNS